MKLNLMNKQKIDSYFMNLSCEEINYLYETYFNKPKEAINYTRCSTQLPDAKEQEDLVEMAYTLNLQNLSGREHFDKAFRLGIEVGFEELTEHLQNKAIV